MSELEESVKKVIEPLILSKGLLLDELHYIRKGHDNYLQVYIEREDEPVSLDEIVKISEDLSPLLDECDLIKEEYVLDVSTSGAEKPIKDFKKFPKYIGKYMTVKLKNPIKEGHLFTGDLVDANDQNITISYRQKTRVKQIVLPIENIAKANLAIKF